MKQITLLAVVITFFISSCCIGLQPYEIATIKLSYPNITTTSYLKAIRKDEINAINSYIDTIYVGELNTSNSFSAIIEFGDIPYNYYIYVENTTYMDSITEISYDREDCDDRIVNFKYKFNGELLTDNELIIND